MHCRSSVIVKWLCYRSYISGDECFNWRKRRRDVPSVRTKYFNKNRVWYDHVVQISFRFDFKHFYRLEYCWLATALMGLVKCQSESDRHTHTTILLLFWSMSGTTRVSRYQKGKTRKVKTVAPATPALKSLSQSSRWLKLIRDILAEKTDVAQFLDICI